jgi:hypothetical protein
MNFATRGKIKKPGEFAGFFYSQESELVFLVNIFLRGGLFCLKNRVTFQDTPNFGLEIWQCVLHGKTNAFFYVGSGGQFLPPPCQAGYVR